MGVPMDRSGELRIPWGSEVDQGMLGGCSKVGREECSGWNSAVIYRYVECDVMEESDQAEIDLLWIGTSVILLMAYLVLFKMDMF